MILSEIFDALIETECCIVQLGRSFFEEVDFVLSCQGNPLGAQLTSTMMKGLNHHPLAWSARFPFLAKADDVCPHQDNSIGITLHTSFKGLQPYCCLIKDKGNIDILCNLLSVITD